MRLTLVSDLSCSQRMRAACTPCKGTCACVGALLRSKLGVRSRKGHLQFFMKEYDAAMETYEAGLARDPDNGELKEGVARCWEAINKARAQHTPAPVPLFCRRCSAAQQLGRDLHNNWQRAS